MAVLPNPVSRQHVDEDSDDLFQARQNINDALNAVNGIRQYLAELFGTDGSKKTAIATMFSNQAVLFPAGTNMYFVNHSTPPGWIKWTQLSPGHYLMAVSDNTGGIPFGDFNVHLQSFATTLIREHLPAVNLVGWTDWVGEHAHSYEATYGTFIHPGGNPVPSQRAGSGDDKTWIYHYQFATQGSGTHYHTITLPLGGSNWGHDHWTSMASYRPLCYRGVIGQKA